MIIGYSIIIPVYNSESTLEPLCERLVMVLENITEAYEIILINDGSLDRSSIIMEKINKINSNFRIINLMRNYGQHNALLCGMRIAKYNMTITIDDDLQYQPEEIPKLIEKLNEGYDVVYGYPKKLNHGIYRNIASILTKIILKTSMGVQTARYVSPFRLFKTDLCRAFEDYKGSFVSVDVLLSWGTNSFSSILINHDLRSVGKTNYTLKKLLNHAFNMLTGFTIIPLQIASLIGFTFSIFGFMILFYVVLRYFLYGSPVPGFPFIASIISIFSGAQLLAIGIIGEYIARIHSRVMDKPQYTIKDSK